MDEDTEALAEALWVADHRGYPVEAGATFAAEGDRALYRWQAEDFLASDWLAAHDAQVRAEALAPIEALCRENQVQALDGTVTDADTIWPSEVLAALEAKG